MAVALTGADADGEAVADGSADEVAAGPSVAVGVGDGETEACGDGLASVPVTAAVWRRSDVDEAPGSAAATAVSDTAVCETTSAAMRARFFSFMV